MCMRFSRPVACATIFPVALACPEARTALSPVRTAVAIPGAIPGASALATRSVVCTSGPVATRSGVCTRRRVAIRAVAAPWTAIVLRPVRATAFTAAALRPITKSAFAVRTRLRGAITIMGYRPAFAAPLRPLSPALIAPCVRTLVAARTIPVALVVAPAFKGPRLLVDRGSAFWLRLHRIVRTALAPTICLLVAPWSTVRKPARTIALSPSFWARAPIFKRRTLRTSTGTVATIAATVPLLTTLAIPALTATRSKAARAIIARTTTLAACAAGRQIGPLGITFGTAFHRCDKRRIVAAIL